MPKSKGFLQQLRYDAAVQKTSQVDPFNKPLWVDDLPTEMASPAFTFIFSGPPLASQMQGDADGVLTPIGLVQDIQLSSQRQLAPLPELGNRHFRHVGGRWNHSASISRVLSLSGNILGMMYRWYIGSAESKWHLPPTSGQGDTRRGSNTRSLHVVSPDSDLLDYPFGLYVVKLTEEGDFISGQYWERCMISGFTDQIQSAGAIVMESIQLVFSRIVPMDRGSVPQLEGRNFTITGNAQAAGGGGGAVTNRDLMLEAEIRADAAAARASGQLGNLGGIIPGL